jgi:hypothetical protein
MREFSSSQTAADLVTLNGIQTLTNKSLNAAVLSVPRLNSVKDPNGNSFIEMAYKPTASTWVALSVATTSTVESTNPDIGLIARSLSDPNVNVSLVTKGTGWVEVAPTTGNVARISAGTVAANTTKDINLNLTGKNAGVVQANGVPVTTGATATGGLPLSLWTGTKAQYDALTKSATTIYVVTTAAATLEGVVDGVTGAVDTGDISSAEPEVPDAVTDAVGSAQDTLGSVQTGDIAVDPPARTATTKSTRKK